MTTEVGIQASMPLCVTTVLASLCVEASDLSQAHAVQRAKLEEIR